VTAAYVGQPIDVLATRLKAPTILRGRVTRTRSDLVSVDVQLISTADGSNWWSQHVDLALDDSAGRSLLGQRA
jgi:TolB-like protein